MENSENEKELSHHHKECCNHENHSHNNDEHHEHEQNCSCHSHNHKHEHHHDNLKCSCCHDEDEEHEEDKKVVIKKITISALLLIFGLLIEHSSSLKFLKKIIPDFSQSFSNDRLFYVVLYLVSYLTIAKDVIRGAVSNIRKGNIFGEQFLMCVASIGAIFVGEFAEGVAVMLLYTIGEFFQDYAVDKSRDSISALMDIRPETANVIRNGKIENVSPNEIKIGEIIEVKPGERIALDGKIIEGESFADTSALTGESVPRKIKINDEVLAGFVNTQGLIKIEVSKLNSESAITRILNLTQQESAVKARSEKFITRFSKVYTPIVCILAVFVAVFPASFLKLFYPETFVELGGYQTFIYRALMFLVVSCPCALVISVPLTFFSGIGAFSKNGILVKGSNFVENLAKLSTVVFDKTGTLTKGVFSVTKIKSFNIEENEFLKLVSLAESKSNHPISKSIIEYYKKSSNQNNNENCEIEKIEEIAGHGIKAIINKKEILVGNSKLMKAKNVKDFDESKLSELNEEIGTIVFVAVDSKFEGYLVISDEIKENSKNALQKLKKVGVKKTVMLTGDHEKVANQVANILGIDEVHANLLPENKVQEIEKLINSANKNEKVAFVGDGVNDSPVLARADVGIAMGGLGSDAAIEAADVVIMDDNLERLSKGIKIARKTVKIVTQNIIFSLAVKIAIMILSALGITNMWVAVFGDVGVCFLAILNAIR